MKFTNKDELIEQARKDGACDKGIEFANSCKDLQDIFETIDDSMLRWCLIKGYEQFAEHCDLSVLDGSEWARLLIIQPQFSDRCDWGKLDGWGWSRLLIIQPKFADRCDWGKLDAADWYRLLSNQPQFASYQN